MAKKETTRNRPTVGEVKELRAALERLEATLKDRDATIGNVRNLAATDRSTIHGLQPGLAVGMGLAAEIIDRGILPTDLKERLYRFLEVRPRTESSFVSRHFAGTNQATPAPETPQGN